MVKILQFHLTSALSHLEENILQSDNFMNLTESQKLLTSNLMNFSCYTVLYALCVACCGVCYHCKSPV